MEDPIVNSEILHDGEGRDVERWLKSRNKFFVFAIACLFIYISLLSCTCVVASIAHFKYCLHFIHHCITFFAFIYRSLLISIIRQLSTSTHNLKEYTKRSSRALHGKFDFNSYFEWPVCIILHSCYYFIFDWHYTYSLHSRCIFNWYQSLVL